MTADIHAQKILILDFGSQYTQLIARRVREIGVYCELYPYDMAEDDIRAFGANAIILSGGPETVTDDETPRCWVFATACKPWLLSWVVKLKRPISVSLVMRK